jgi:protein arginine kinase activator
MICHVCKDKVATIRLKEIVGDVVTELHLCQECFRAREREGISGAVPMDKMLGAPADAGKKKTKTKAKSEKCAACGMTEEQFRSKGRLGCSQCYETFAKTLEPFLTKIHGGTEHRGKVPHHALQSLDMKNELRRLQEDLQRAISSENYERAAKLRDKIKQFESM